MTQWLIEEACSAALDAFEQHAELHADRQAAVDETRQLELRAMALRQLGRGGSG